MELICLFKATLLPTEIQEASICSQAMIPSMSDLYPMWYFQFRLPLTG